jgi:G:T-mismatch repair DNA endonuclease (very short patch repair protein)
MSKFIFTLPEAAAKKGIQSVGGKYNFKDGKLVVEEDIARKIKKVLTTFHGCTVSQEKAPVAEKNVPAPEDAVLSKTATKATKGH